MVEDSAPFSELPPVSLIVQSSRFYPTGGKLSSDRSRRLGSSIGMSDRSSSRSGNHSL